MRQILLTLAAVATLAFAPQTVPAQSKTVVVTATKSVAARLPLPALTPLSNAATPAQIREYITLSGELDAYRIRWVGALASKRSLGAPYWPESFWSAMKSSMEHADLLPMYTVWYQHTITQDLMQRVLETYKSAGADHFRGTPACFELGGAQLPYQSEMDQLTLSNTLAVLNQVYDLYKPQIKAARADYMARHPDYKD